MKKLLKKVVAITICFLSIGFHVHAHPYEETNIPKVVWSDGNSKIIYLGAETESNYERSNLTQNYTFNFLHTGIAYNTGNEVELAKFSVTHTSIYDGNSWGYDHRGIYSYTPLRFPFSLDFWECTYFNGTNYMQSAYRFEVNGYTFKSGPLVFLLNTNTGTITFSGDN